MRRARLIAVPLTAVLSVGLLAGCNDPAGSSPTPTATMSDDTMTDDTMTDEPMTDEPMTDEG